MTNVIFLESRRRKRAGDEGTPRTLNGFPLVAGEVIQTLWTAGDGIVQLIDGNGDGYVATDEGISKVNDILEDLRNCADQWDLAEYRGKSVWSDASLFRLRLHIDQFFKVLPEEENYAGDLYEQDLYDLGLEMLCSDPFDHVRLWCSTRPDDMRILKDFFLFV